jgi:hypothetical protein
MSIFNKWIKRAKPAEEATIDRSYSPTEIFVSYSRTDTAKMQEVVTWLQDQGISADKFFVDIGSIDGALKFTKVIADAIESCKVVIFFVSKSSLKSEWVQNEIFYARKKSKPVLAIHLEPVQLPSEIEIILGQYQNLELFRGNKIAIYLAIFKSLKICRVTVSERSSSIPSAGIANTEKSFTSGNTIHPIEKQIPKDSPSPNKAKSEAKPAKNTLIEPQSKLPEPKREMAVTLGEIRVESLDDTTVSIDLPRIKVIETG